MLAQSFYRAAVVSKTLMSKKNHPYQGWIPGKKRTEEVLLVCYFEPNGISTVPENISYLQALSDFPIRVLNLCEDRSDGGFLKLNPFTRLDDYDAVVIHNTIAYNPDNLESLDTTISPDFGEYEGVKVIFKQDENYRARSTASFIGSRQFDLVFSCLPEEEIAKVYPAALAGTPRFVRMLTGYVTQNLRELAFDGARPRPIDIGYRGSIQPLSFGKLSYEKRRIGDDVAARASKIGLVTDISSLWEDRFSGSAWLEFLGRCKATLGVESGASIFDLDDTLEERCTRLERELSKLRHNGSFDEEFLSRLKDLEGNVYYNQISPRHFEAAATRTLQVLFPGKYSGILAAGKHYVALERDYGNFDEIADVILDPKRRKEIVDRTFLEIVQNRAYWIETFVERFDSAVSGCLHDKGRAQAPVFAITQPHHNILLIAAHDPYLDPRLEWIEYHAPNGMCIHQLGVSTKEAKEPSYRTGKKGGAEIVVPRADHAENFEWLVESLRCSPANVGAAELNSLYCLLGLPETHLNFWLGAIRGSERIKLFRWYLKYFLDINATLIRHASAMRGIDGIIATDLYTLPAALVLKQRFDAPVFYDAHEYWPEADVSAAEWEIQFWRGVENRLVQAVDYAQTVSKNLAELMSMQYGKQFFTLPNCEPLRDTVTLVRRETTADDAGNCIFLFLGAFAPRRGIDLLIRAWPQTHQKAVLHLRGVDNEEKRKMMKLAKALGLLDHRIFFPAAVAESDLVDAASRAHVGLIPYTPHGLCYRHCCPNKLSQYMAAGIPIIANKLDFVESILTEAKCGVSVDFSNKDVLASTINRYTNNREQRKVEGELASQYYRSRFNWQAMSGGFYKQLETLTASPQPTQFQVYGELRAAHVSSGDLEDRSKKMELRQRLIEFNRTVAAPESVSSALGMAVFFAARRVWRMLPEEVRFKLGPKVKRYTKNTNLPYGA